MVAAFFLVLIEAEIDERPCLSRRIPSHFPDSRSGVALLRLLLSIMTGARRGFGFPGRK
jgi:hypothetical protein